MDSRPASCRNCAHFAVPAGTQAATIDASAAHCAKSHPLPANLDPCPDYAMSGEFRAWVVARMMDESRKATSDAGLNRMAIVKDQNAAANPRLDATRRRVARPRRRS